jgi:hypothetical protein
MTGTYFVEGKDGKTFVLHRDELERLIGWNGIMPCKIGNLVTRKVIRVSGRRPLTWEDVANISNDPA